MVKTHIVLVHGAYHTPWCYHLLQQCLEEAGYSVSAPQLPSAGQSPETASLASDASTIISATEDAAKTADKIVVVSHSYGGIPTSDAVAQLEDSIKAKIVRLVYLAAILVDPGNSMTTLSCGKTAKWSPCEGNILTVPDPMTVFYHDVEPEALAKEACERVVKQAYASMAENARSRGREMYPVTHVHCLQDKAVPVEIFRKRVDSLVEAYGMRDRWQVVDVDSGHSPFLAKPEETAKIIRRAAGQGL